MYIFVGISFYMLETYLLNHMKDTKKKMLFVKVSNASFIKLDESILRKHFHLTTYFYGTSRGLKAIFSLIKLFLYLLVNVWNYSIIYIWFADYHSVFPALFTSLFKKKTVIVLGGFDVAKIPEHNYGAHISVVRSLFIRASCKFSYKLFAVSSFVKLNSLKTIGLGIEHKTVAEVIKQLKKCNHSSCCCIAQFMG